MRKVRLLLNNGEELHGYSFGYEGNVEGSLVFCTSMNGYIETLTDPAYRNSLLVMTYPLLGNYGVPNLTLRDSHNIPLYGESNHISPKAVIVADYSKNYSHWDAVEELSEWMKREQTIGVTGIDTRKLAHIIATEGNIHARIITENIPEDNRVEEKSFDVINTPQTYNKEKGKKILLVDCGMKNSLLRELVKYDIEIVRVPANYEFTSDKYDALIIAGGPGAPHQYMNTICNIQKFFETGKAIPCLGIGIGMEIMAMAIGASIYPLKAGHHGNNQPVRLNNTPTCSITSQQQSYAIDPQSLPATWETTFTNLNDGVTEGFRSTQHPWQGVEFTPYGNDATPFNILHSLIQTL